MRQRASNHALIELIKILSKNNDIFEFQYEDFKLINYQSHTKISAPIAI